MSRFMKEKINIITLALVTLTVFTFVPKSFADDGILIVYGDHIEMVCGDDGLVDVYHTILESSNITKNVTSESTYSFGGILVGDVSYEYDPEIHESEVLYNSKDETSMIFVNFNATLNLLNSRSLSSNIR